MILRRNSPPQPLANVQRRSGLFLCLRLLQIEAHVHLAVHARGSGQVLASLLRFAGALVQLAEAEMAVGDDGPHAARLGERQGLAIVGFASLDVELVAIGRDVAERAGRRGRQVPGCVENIGDSSWPAVRASSSLSEQQSGAAQATDSRAKPDHCSTRYPALEQFFALLQHGPAPLPACRAAPSMRSQSEATAWAREIKTFPVRYTADRAAHRRARLSQSPWQQRNKAADR